ncbi:MAG: (2Fe-2S)-binding protein [Planctomycetaceae bacterium]|nr:(2Fe-2S)-binding protein [Planctomycetaceae bacterium]|tara:strand:+ start:20768 stop:21082 length:315 start_codon:yes stop_codon:yes gene_type:complete
MQLDEDICLCFHVSKRKVINFIRNQNPSAASQLSQCFGAGTGCGWCRPHLENLYQQLQFDSSSVKGHSAADSVEVSTEQAAENYAALRRNYLKNRSGGSSSHSP